MLVVDCEFGYTHGIGRLQKFFEPGSWYGIAGQNGSGKSALLRTISGELEPMSGTIEVSGVDPASAEGAGCVVRVAEPIFYPDLTIGEHLGLLSKSTGIDYTPVVAQRQLQELLPHFPSRLSSGQLQRVYLGSQLSLETSVMLFDEPERHLDEQWLSFLSAQLRSKLDSGTILLVASHSRPLLDCCDEVIEL